MPAGRGGGGEGVWGRPGQAAGDGRRPSWASLQPVLLLSLAGPPNLPEVAGPIFPAGTLRPRLAEVPGQRTLRAAGRGLGLRVQTGRRGGCGEGGAPRGNGARGARAARPSPAPGARLGEERRRRLGPLPGRGGDPAPEVEGAGRAGGPAPAQPAPRPAPPRLAPPRAAAGLPSSRRADGGADGLVDRRARRGTSGAQRGECTRTSARAAGSTPPGRPWGRRPGGRMRHPGRRPAAREVAEGPHPPGSRHPLPLPRSPPPPAPQVPKPGHRPGRELGPRSGTAAAARSPPPRVRPSQAAEVPQAPRGGPASPSRIPPADPFALTHARPLTLICHTSLLRTQASHTRAWHTGVSQTRTPLSARRL